MTSIRRCLALPTIYAILVAAGIALFLLVSVFESMVAQTNTVGDAEPNGIEYIVQSGDSLSAIAERYYGDGSAWRRIVEATNALAEVDTSYSQITTPSLIRSGQRLWLPNVAETRSVESTATSLPATPPLTPTVTNSTPTTTISTTPATISDTIVSTPTARAEGVSFANLDSGATISSATVISMTAVGLDIEPAGEIRDGAGHMHILVNTDFVPAGQLIINDEQHLHYGQGELTTTLDLEPGEHILRLQFANGAHVALEGPEYRDEIRVLVAPRDEPSPQVRFISPADGDIVAPTFTVEMDALGMVVEPAGEIRDGAGHMHILVDTDFVASGELIINDNQHLHYGQGELTTTLELEPGEHILRLQYANGAHVALDGNQYRDEIRISVELEEASPTVRFVSPKNGDIVSPSFEVEMDARGIIVEPAGEIRSGAGHLHILIDTDFVPAGELIINDSQHLHYGQGELVTTLELEPGEHTLRLQFANGAHIALDGDEYQDEITITVEE